jgi:hypothetical protein
MTFSKSPKHWEALQHVDVIVRSSHAKEIMPNSEVVMFHNLKYHAALSIVAFVHSLPRKWAILPTPMHVFDASKHTSHILCQYSSCVFFIWFPQIEFPKHRHHRSGKPGNETQPNADSHLYYL